jgi:hypothetical protein
MIVDATVDLFCTNCDKEINNEDDIVCKKCYDQLQPTDAVRFFDKLIDLLQCSMKKENVVIPWEIAMNLKEEIMRLKYK